MLNSISLFMLGFFAWLTSTLAAGGGAILIIPPATCMLGPTLFIPTLSLGSLIANIQRAFLFKKQIHWPSLFFILPGVILGALLGTFLFSKIKAPWLTLLVAIFLLTHVFKSYRRPEKKTFKMRPYFFLPASFITALLSSIAGATGPVMNPFYLNSNITKEEMIGTKAIASLIMQVFKVIGYISFIEFTSQIWIYGLSLGIGAIFGNIIGKKLLERISLKRFRSIVNSFILIGALGLIFKYFTTYSS